MNIHIPKLTVQCLYTGKVYVNCCDRSRINQTESANFGDLGQNVSLLALFVTKIFQCLSNQGGGDSCTGPYHHYTGRKIINNQHQARILEVNYYLSIYNVTFS